MIYNSIYKITNKLNNKVYIGKSRNNPIKRFNAHMRHAMEDNKYNNHFYNAIKKYGKDNFIIETIEKNIENEQKLQEREKYWIQFYKSYDKNFGYNKTLGGDGGNTWALNDHKEETSKKLSYSIKNSEKHKAICSSEEWKEKLKKIMRPIWDSKEFGDKISRKNKGRVVTEEARKNMSIGGTGKILTQLHKDNIGKSVSKRFENPKEREKISKRFKGKPSHRKGKNLSQSHCENIGKANKGKKRTQITCDNISHALRNSIKFKEFSESRRGANNNWAKSFLIIDGNGKEYNIKGNIKQFCKDNNLYYGLFIKFENKGKIILNNNDIIKWQKTIKNLNERLNIQQWEIKKIQ